MTLCPAVAGGPFLSKPVTGSMSFEITILGNNSAIPAYGRHPTAQYIHIHDSAFLVDCGEGTQMQMSQYHVRRARLHHIFISHLHGDHYFGLIGLITSMHLNKRTEKLRIFSPPGLQEIVELQLKASDTQLGYELEFILVDTHRHLLLFENEQVRVFSIPLNHRIPTCGFLFEEKKSPRRVNAEACRLLEVPLAAYNALKSGADYTGPNGEVIANSLLTTAGSDPLRYAFCSDTLYDERIIPLVAQVDLLYHESTFLEDAASRAAETFHSTARQAATVASKAGVQRLILGHFSAKYKDTAGFRQEAASIFEAVEIAEEGTRFELRPLPVGTKKVAP